MSGRNFRDFNPCFEDVVDTDFKNLFLVLSLRVTSKYNLISIPETLNQKLPTTYLFIGCMSVDSAFGTNTLLIFNNS